MSELQKGDKVQTGNRIDNLVFFTFFFNDQLKDAFCFVIKCSLYNIVVHLLSYFTNTFLNNILRFAKSYVFLWLFWCYKIIYFKVSSDGSVKYSDVRTFMRKDHNVITKYLSITTYCNKTLTLSPNHLVYARKVSSDEFNPM